MPFESHTASDRPSATENRPDIEDAAEQASEEEIAAVAPVWLQRLSLFVLVLFCVYLGVLVMILPWWTRMWDQNGLIQAHPAVAAVLHMGAVRGLISGLGLLDIWIGVSEAIHYRDHRA
ncbi:MAG TPA: hypothetical protein VGU46_08925 [Acidobacteriaceae bacterium]|nr:hypothetical protein [Acidobacteriaceae bacterium]